MMHWLKVNSMGLANRAKLEARLRVLEGKELGRSAGSTKGKPKIEVYDKDRKKGAGALLTAAKTYNPSSDLILSHASKQEVAKDITEGEEKTKPVPAEEATAHENGGLDKGEKKKKSKAEAEVMTIEQEQPQPESQKKKKKKKGETEEEQVEQERPQPESEKKKKKKKGEVEEEHGTPAAAAEEVVEMKGKKKKRKHTAVDEAVDRVEETTESGKDKKKKQKHRE